MNKRTEAVANFAASRGYEFTTDFDRGELGVRGETRTLGSWVAGHNLVRGSCRGLDFQAFDMTKSVTSYDAEGVETSSEARQFVFALANQSGLEPIQLFSSGGVANALFNFASRSGVELSIDNGMPADNKVVSQFNASYFCDGDGFEAGMELREAPKGISMKLLETMSGSQDWSIEVTSSHLLLFLRRQPDIDMLSEVLDEAAELVGVLTHPPRGQQLMTRRLPPVGMASLMGGMIWIFGGAVVGMIATMAIFGTLVVAVGNMPRWAIFTFPVVGLALMIAGAFASIKIRNRGQGK
ncbi:MAG: hypothetical protein AB8G99_22930 [Planctomycetaceae bacterium]